MKAEGCLLPLPETAVICVPRFPNQLHPWKTEAILFSNCDSLWNAVREFLLIFLNYHSAISN